MTNATVEKMLPQNVEAEVGVLGSLLIDSNAVVHVADFLRPDDFYRDIHRTIYQAVLDLHDAGSTADLITLTDELQRRGKLDEVGGIFYVSSLANNVPTYRNIRQYARIVERTAVLRRLIHAAGHIAGVAYNEPDADVALASAEDALLRIAERHTGTRHTARRVGDALSDYTNRLDALQTQHGAAGLVGIPSGYRDLDVLTSGWRKGNLVLLAARPALGKTSMALGFARDAAHAGYGVAFFSLEMSEDEILERLVAMESGVDLTALRTGRLNDEEWQAVMAGMARMEDMPLYIEDTPALTVADVRRRVRRQRLDHPVDLVIVDYLQIMAGGSGGESGKSENRVQEVSAISRGLKNLARELDLPLIALSQLSRAVENRADKKPMLSDLRESGSLEQDSDMCMFIHREEVYNPDTERKHIADLILAKHRNGPLGQIELYFDGRRTRYANLERRYATDTAPASVAAGVSAVNGEQWWTEGEQ